MTVQEAIDILSEMPHDATLFSIGTDITFHYPTVGQNIEIGKCINGNYVFIGHTATEIQYQEMLHLNLNELKELTN